jgi:hypothetical protein
MCARQFSMCVRPYSHLKVPETILEDLELLLDNFGQLLILLDNFGQL